jgi:hypothetical protein
MVTDIAISARGDYNAFHKNVTPYGIALKAL